jgi:hypothetical protein
MGAAPLEPVGDSGEAQDTREAGGGLLVARGGRPPLLEASEPKAARRGCGGRKPRAGRRPAARCAWPESRAGRRRPRSARAGYRRCSPDRRRSSGPGAAGGRAGRAPGAARWLGPALPRRQRHGPAHPR